MDNPEFKIGPDTDRLVDREKSWTRMDKLLLVFGVVVNLGDGVEIYLPGSSNTITTILRSLAGFFNTAKASIVCEAPCLSINH